MRLKASRFTASSFTASSFTGHGHLAGLFKYLSGTICSFILASSVSAQQYGTVAVTQDKVLGRGGQCVSNVRNIATPDGKVSFDTIVARVLENATSNKVVKPPVQIVLTRDGIPLGALPDTADSLVLAIITNQTVTVTYALKTGEGRDLCKLAIAATGPLPVDTSSAARQAARDSLARMGLYKIASESGNGFVILSLIKSISGQIPKDEFFDVRMKFGGDFGDFSFASADSAKREAARLQAIAIHAKDKYTRDRTQADSVEMRRSEEVASNAEKRWRSLASTLIRRSKVFTFASVDISLSARTESGTSDTVTNRSPTDAQLSINYILSNAWRGIPDRLGYLGGVFKVFDSRSFLGAQYGGLELRGSRLEGTAVSVAYLNRLYSDSIVKTAAVPANAVSNTPAVPATYSLLKSRHYAYLEFYLRVREVQFLDRIRVRGGLLLPFGPPVRERLTYRVALSVPIADLTRF